MVFKSHVATDGRSTRRQSAIKTLRSQSVHHISMGGHALSNRKAWREIEAKRSKTKQNEAKRSKTKQHDGIVCF
jgi:hypothetical protein